MKTILGLDLGTTSIGWALVNQSENDNETSGIIKLGVRVNPLSTDEQTDFEKGRPLSINADRTLKRGARRNLQRFKQRRKCLINILIKHKLITDKTLLTEIGKQTTHQTLYLRAKSAKQRIEKEELARVLLAINKKRGYKSNRKAKDENDGQAIDGMSIAKELYDNNLTVGQYVLQLLGNGKKYIPDFYRSDLQNEFDKIWAFQKQFYEDILTDELYEELQGKNKSQTWKICEQPFGIVGEKRTTKGAELKRENYQWRVNGLSKQLVLERLAIALQEINNNLNSSSGYLGAISDRSKELYFNEETVGENLFKQIKENAHTSLKNQVFYRQDYLDEFERIWQTQAEFHPELTTQLKEKIRDVVIFYQRKLKSQKHLISTCEFEQHHKVIPKSSPLFQEFKIWQNLNNLKFKLTNDFKKSSSSQENEDDYVLSQEDKRTLFEELNIRGNLKANDVLKLLGLNTKQWKINFDKIEGNRTNEILYNIYQKIADEEGYGYSWAKKTAYDIKQELETIFPLSGIDKEILSFDSCSEGNDFDKQASYQLWHLLYSAEDDINLKKSLQQKHGFNQSYASMMSSVGFKLDYGHLSAKAIKKIIPFLKEGNDYSESCALAGYNHSRSLTKEENKARKLLGKLELVPKNSLRNPVVEKILNQMINIINMIIDQYGKPDEIRIELARELKKSAKERAETIKFIASGTKHNDEVRKIIKKDFGIPNPTKNDIIKYKLYQELERRGHKTLFTNQYIDKSKLYSSEIDIEHIIPKAKLFDDSFSNKTLAYRAVNLAKRDRTAIDFIESDYNSDLDSYIQRVEELYDKGKGVISKGKYKKLLMSEKDLPDGFIERDLRNSQYIAKKAKQILLEVVRNVNSTSGTITARLREDWDLISVMKELNLPKYRTLGLTHQEQRKNNKSVEQIKDWTKRNDHRHHAMDALAVAFTSHSHVQYLSNLSAISRKDKRFVNLKDSVTKVYKLDNGKSKRKFIPPMDNFRQQAKKHIECILISFKAKNKVVTKNINKTKTKDGYKKTEQLTPRGQLHKETIYGKHKSDVIKKEKIGTKFSKDKINQVTVDSYRKALLKRLSENDNNPKKAFGGKNALSKKPIYTDEDKTQQVPFEVKTKSFENIYTIRKEVSPDIKLDKVIDQGVRRALEKRLKEYSGDKKKAFSDLGKNPIWLNKDKGIAIKRVAITGVKDIVSLHDKKDHLGNDILLNGVQQAVDFVSTGNNHHVAIYRDSKGKLQERIMSFYEAVTRATQKLSIVDRDYKKEEGYEFLFTMKQNEMFVFPDKENGFSPKDTDLLDEKNSSEISKHLFRIQSVSTKYYMFRHHLESIVTNNISGVTYHMIRSTEPLRDIIKVRINHLGQIVHVGEY